MVGVGDVVTEVGEAVLPVEGPEAMLVVGPVVLCCRVLVLCCVGVAGWDEVNKGELPGDEVLLVPGVDIIVPVLGVDRMLLGASVLPIVEGSTSERSAQPYGLAAITHQRKTQKRER